MAWKGRLLAAAMMAGALMLGAGRPAAAEDLIPITVGRAVATAFVFGVPDVGVEAGIWKKNGIDLKILSFNGDAQLQQAMAAGSVDFGLGSGPAMGYAVKGVPAKAVAAMAGAPDDMALVATSNHKAKTLDDLQGQKVGCTTAGSLTKWLIKKLSAEKGWTGADALQPTPVGSERNQLAAMKTGAIQASIGTTTEGATLEVRKEGRIILPLGSVVTDFITHVIFARDDLIKNHPDTVRKFLKGWFETVAYMKTHEGPTLKVGEKLLNAPEAVVRKTYPTDIVKMLSNDGSFDPAAVKVVAQSLVALGILKTEPTPDQMYTSEFVPVKLGK
jgi:ABC-type nitrate/sulfonate/bicarbonate transport system substrate-binding protein